MSLSNLLMIYMFFSRGGIYGPHDLQINNNTDFCSVCHEPHSAKNSVLLSLLPDAPIQTRNPDEGVDSVSLFCLACHSDGGPVSDIITSKSLLGLSLIDDHPVGLRYDILSYRARNYVPAFHLPREVSLRDGKITCATCHDPHAKQDGPMLRMPTNVLCTSCHLIEVVDSHVMIECEDCHQMHGAWSSSFLKNESTMLCSSCHIILSTNHPEDSFECVYCHNPHRTQTMNKRSILKKP